VSILDTIDGALADYEASGDAMRWVPEAGRTEEKRPADAAALIEAFGQSMTQAAAEITRMFDALRPVVQAQAKLHAKFLHSMSVAFYPKQHQRCVTCHPWRKPKPLAVNGREYQRRLRARRRRNRR
jgi:hypothetical protein